jgi:hypothetical protein
MKFLIRLKKIMRKIMKKYGKYLLIDMHDVEKKKKRLIIDE